MSDGSSDVESGDDACSPVRRVHRLLHTSDKIKPRRKKKMPPELQIIPAPVRQLIEYNYILNNISK